LGIYGDYQSTATILTGGPSLEIGLYAQFNSMRGGWPCKKLLYAQNSKKQRWLEALKVAMRPKQFLLFADSN
jgi:hypothetical protein